MMTTLKPFDPVQNLSPEEMLDLLGEAYDENDRLRDLVCQYQAGKVSDLYREENQ